MKNENNAKDVLLHEVVVVLDDVRMVKLYQDLHLLLCRLSVHHLLDGKPFASLFGQEDLSK